MDPIYEAYTETGKVKIDEAITGDHINTDKFLEFIKKTQAADSTYVMNFIMKYTKWGKEFEGKYNNFQFIGFKFDKRGISAHIKFDAPGDDNKNLHTYILFNGKKLIK